MKLTSFKIGCFVVLIAVLIFYSFGTRKPDLLTALDNKVTDAMFHWRGPQPVGPQIVIVDLDERSLREVGQWPWPRDVIAAMLANIGAGGATAIGLDMVFAEPDRTSPGNYMAELGRKYPSLFVADQLEQLLEMDALDHDQTLGAVLSGLPSVLGYVFQLSDDNLKDPDKSPFPAALIRLEPADATFTELNTFSAYRPILNVDPVSQAESEGFFNVFPDLDGTVRKVPLLITFDGIPYPSLALELARMGLGADTITLHADPTAYGGQRSLLGVSLGQSFIPTDEKGQLTVNYRGSAYSFPYVSATDVLNNVDSAIFLDRIVLIGTSAAGLLDLRATPFSSSYPGVEVHATVIDNILAADPLIHDIHTEIGLTYLMIVIGGLLLTALLAYGGPLIGGVGALLLIGTTVAGNYQFLFKQQLVVGLMYPLTVLIFLFMVVTLFNYFFEGRKKRYISRAFSQYVPPELVDEMASRADELALGGETREMSVLFSDVRGFTTISEKLDAAELTQLMNNMLTPLTRIIHNHRGTIDKYMGDAIMAFWGAPLQDKDHARHALEAGLAMIAVIPKIQQEFLAKGWPPIQIGVGINSGLMNVGNMGSEFRMAYTVLGDAVNLGSRLEGLTKQYGVDMMVSEYTRELAPDFVYRELDRVRVKGKDTSVTIYQPLGYPGDLDATTLEGLELHHLALEHYRNRKFAPAQELFSELLHRKPEDPLYRLYLERVTDFMTQPPSADWDGSYTHTNK